MNYVETGSGLIVPEYITRRTKRPIAFDFFCGAGGMGCGLIQSGIEIVGANEYDPFASLTYLVNLGHYPVNIHYLDGEAGKNRLDKAVMKAWGLKNEDELTPETFKKIFGTGIEPKHYCSGGGWISKTDFPGVKNFWFGDIHKLKGRDILDALGLKQGDLDLVAGGPPCQGFSRAGKQEITDPRNNLVYEYARLIVELQPKTFIMEEVPDIVNFFDPEGVPVLDKFCLLLEDGGYGKWEIIKKSLLTQTGAAAVIRDRKNTAKKQKQAEKHQRELF